MFIPKKKKIKDKRYLQYVANLSCCLEEQSHDWCQGVIQAHHLLRPYHGSRGMGMKAEDNNCVPLCQFHHARLHDAHGNEDSFWKHHGLDADFGRSLAKELYERYLNEKERFFNRK